MEPEPKGPDGEEPEARGAGIQAELRCVSILFCLLSGRRRGCARLTIGDEDIVHHVTDRLLDVDQPGAREGTYTWPPIFLLSLFNQVYRLKFCTGGCGMNR